MRRNIAASRLSLGFCILLLVTIFVNPSFSQEPQISVFTEIEVKPGMNFEFEKFLKEEVLPAMKKGGQQEMSVWKSAVLGTGGTYSLSSPLASFAQFDNPHPIFKALGPYGAQAMFAKMKQFATSVRTFTMTSLPDLAIAAPEGYVSKLGLQIKATIAPGRNEEYEKATKVIVEIFKKTNAKGFLTGRVGLGGNPNQYYFLLLFDSFADIDAFGMAFRKAMSETKVPQETGIVTLSEFSMYRYDSELSIQPAAQ